MLKEMEKNINGKSLSLLIKNGSKDCGVK